MTEPVQALPESLQGLVRAERARPEPPAGAQDRVFARLSASLGWPGTSGASPSAPAPSTMASDAPVRGLGRRLAWFSRRGLLTFMAGAAVGATAYGGAVRLARAPEPSPSVVATSTPRPVPAESQAPSRPEPSVASTPHLATTPAVAPRRHPDSGDARDRGLAAERKLIEMARTSFVRGQPEAALGLLARHTREFPNGQLSEERDSLYVQVLVATGATDQARVRGKHFLRRYPHSLFAPVVEQALRSIP
jgi:hypothetical protein